MSGYTGYALRFISGKYQGGEFPLKANREIIIGRGSELDMVLVEDMVSRKHAKIITGEDYVILQDLGSTNGTFVNGERIRKVRLREGDRILIGTSILKLVPYDASASDLAEMEEEGMAAGTPPPPGAGFPSPPPPTGMETSQYVPDSPPPPGASPLQLGSGGFDAAPGVTQPPPDEFAPPDLPGTYGAQEEGGEPSSPPPTTMSPDEPRPQGLMVGNLEETPLPDLLQLFATSRKNGVLIIRSDKEGRIHLRDGRIIYAIIDNNFTVGPIKAIYRILTWSRGNFELLPPNDNEIHEQIDEDIEDLLMEALRQQDEIARYKSQLPPHTHNLSVAMPLRSPLRDLRSDHLDTFQLVYNYGILETILNKAKSSDLETYKHLAFLLKNDYIKAH